MGLEFHGAAMVALARQQKMPMKTVLTLGRQDSALTDDWCAHLKRTYDAPVEGLGYDKEPHGETFFQRLGAERVESLDMSSYQHCSICRDLNEPPPDEQVEGYDLVYDGGTLEHVFHFPNAIANCMSLVKVGGHFMASLPANQWLGHGFYQFSPELFFRVLSPENGFEIVRIFLADNPEGRGRLFRVIDPAESGVRTLLYSKEPMLVMVWARKIAAVKPFQSWPQQSDYSARWKTAKAGNGAGAGQEKSALAKLRRQIGRLVPKAFKAYLANRKYMMDARQGFVELDKLQ